MVPKELSVEQVSGTVWSGNAWVVVNLSQFNLNSSGLLSWRVKPAAWLRGNVAVQVRLESDIGDLRGEIAGSTSSQKVRVDSASLQLEQLNPALQAQRVKLAGVLAMKNIELSAEDGVMAGASGQLYWPGGNVTYPAGRQLRNTDFPAFSGLIGFENGSVTVGIKDQDAAFDSISGVLDADGWFKTKVRKRLIDIAGEPWKNSVSEKQVIFSVKRKLY